MRSFNANFIAEKNKRDQGPAPINLLTFNFATPVYLSDRDVTPPGPACQIPNGDMELDCCWADYHSPSTNERSSEQAHSGTYSRKLSSNSIWDGIQSDPFTTIAGDEYLLTFWIYCNSPNNCIHVDILSGDGTHVPLSEWIYGLGIGYWRCTQRTWQDLYGGANAHVRFSSGSSDYGTWYIDDVTNELWPNPPLYHGLVKSWGFIDTAASQRPGSGMLGSIDVADLSLTIINTESSRFSDNLMSDDPPENVIVELSQWFEGLVYSERETIFKGYIASPVDYHLYECRLTVKSIWHKWNKLIGEDLIITPEDFPNADPDDIGKMRNIGYGSLTDVPCRAIVAGAVDTLRDELDGVTDSFYVSGSSKADFPSGTVVVQIDEEKIQGTYSQATNEFTSCTRGYDSTTAVIHNKGASVAEVLTEYIYEAGAHPWKTIDAVKVDGVKQTADYTAYTGQSGDELAGYEGTAVVKFTVQPSIKKQINLETETDTGLHAHTTASSDETTRTGTGHSDPESQWSNEGNAYDGNEGTYAENLGFTPGDYLIINFDETDLGTVISRRVKIVYSSTLSTSYDDLEVMIGTEAYQQFNGTGGDDTTRTTIYKTFSGGSWNLDVKFNTNGDHGAPSIRINEVEVTITYTGGIDPSPADGVHLTIGGNSTAETVIGQLVTVDGEGYQDDGSGTYTGTPDALIERPDHVFKHLWAEILGADIDDLDSDAFDDAGTFYAANSYAFSLLINQPIQAEMLFMRLALQCRSRFLVTAYGMARLLVRQLEQESGHSIAKNEIKRDSVQVSRSATEDLINLFHIHYDKDHTKLGNTPDNCLKAKKFECGNSIAKYGQREWQGDQTLFCFDAVTLDAMAEDVGNFLRQYHSTVRKIPRLGVFLDNMEIEPGDLIDVTHDLDDMAGFVAEVLKCLHHIGSRDRIDYQEVIAVENRWGE